MDYSIKSGDTLWNIAKQQYNLTSELRGGIWAQKMPLKAIPWGEGAFALFPLPCVFP